MVTLTLIVIYFNVMSHYFFFYFSVSSGVASVAMESARSALRVSVSHLVFFIVDGYDSVISFQPELDRHIQLRSDISLRFVNPQCTYNCLFISL